MKWLTLDKIKQQLRIEPDFHDEDTMLELYGESAEDTLLKYLGSTYEELMETYNDVLPKPLEHASLMLVDQSYQHRSPASPTNMYYVMYGFDMLVKPYMKL